MNTTQEIILFSHNSYAKHGLKAMVSTTHLPSGVKISDPENRMSTTSPIIIVGESVLRDMSELKSFFSFLRKVKVKCIFFICTHETSSFFNRWGVMLGVPFHVFTRNVKAGRLSRYIRHVIITGSLPIITPGNNLPLINISANDLFLLYSRIRGCSWDILQRKYKMQSRVILVNKLKNCCLYLGIPRQIWLKLLHNHTIH